MRKSRSRGRGGGHEPIVEADYKRPDLERYNFKKVDSTGSYDVWQWKGKRMLFITVYDYFYPTHVIAGATRKRRQTFVVRDEKRTHESRPLRKLETFIKENYVDSE